MSRRSIHINIPQPCHVGWENMAATERGAFCHSCQKEVIDFSAMTDKEVVEYLERHKVGCGRFRKDQMDTKISQSVIHKGFRWKTFLLSLFPVIMYESAESKPPPPPATESISHPVDTATMSRRDSIQINGKRPDPYVFEEVLVEGKFTRSHEPRHKVRNWFQHLFKKRNKAMVTGRY